MKGFSVLLTVFINDSPHYLKDCLESILNQSLIPDQLVIVEDGPVSESIRSVIDLYRTKGLFITSIPLEKNHGLGVALNKGLQACHYELVARMDADDICLPDRFEKQINFMAENLDIHVLGAWVEEFDMDMRIRYGSRQTPLTTKDIAAFAKRRSPMNHPTVVFRKSAVFAVGGYPEFRKAQDYALWSVMLSKGYKLKNFGEVLVKMRAGNGLLSRRGRDYLLHELKILKFQREIGFINNFEYYTNFFVRSSVRLAPDFLKRFFYRFAR